MKTAKKMILCLAFLCLLTRAKKLAVISAEYR